MNKDFPVWRQGTKLPDTPAADFENRYCAGTSCPSRDNCRLHANPGAYEIAAWARRQAGDSACQQFKAIRVISTFGASDHAG